jgi:hypothetical protein
MSEDQTPFTHTEYATIKIPLDCIPKGARLIEAYESEKEIVVCGDPPSEYPEGTPEDDQHNCDAMGCATLSHVIYRFRKGEVEKAFELLERATAFMENESPDKTWLEEYFALTGEHMILTDEGWTTGKDRSAFRPEEILAEVNSPFEKHSIQSVAEGAQPHEGNGERPVVT